MPFAVRLKIEDHPLTFHDLVHGEVKFEAEAVSDPVLVRSAHGGASGMSEGVPVYNYVVTIDDALMEITHVIRGDDHLSNTPKQVAIYEAFGMGDAGVRASLHNSGAGPRAAFEAAWSHVDCGVPRDGLSAGGAGELPCAAGLGRGRRQDGNISRWTS